VYGNASGMVSVEENIKGVGPGGGAGGPGAAVDPELLLRIAVNSAGVKYNGPSLRAWTISLEGPFMAVGIAGMPS
jgi:hypothetical protein